MLNDERYCLDAARVTLGMMGPNYDSNKPFTDDDLAAMVPHLNAFRNFNQLDLSGARITDTGLAHLQNLRGLKYLSLGATEVSDNGLAALRVLQGLEELNFVNTKITPGGVEQLKRALPNCAIEH
jgi:hypothetical protein